MSRNSVWELVKFVLVILGLPAVLLIGLAFGGYSVGRTTERQSRDAIACTPNVDSVMLKTDRWGNSITPRRVK